MVVLTFRPCNVENVFSEFVDRLPQRYAARLSVAFLSLLNVLSAYSTWSYLKNFGLCCPFKDCCYSLFYSFFLFSLSQTRVFRACALNTRGYVRDMQSAPVSNVLDFRACISEWGWTGRKDWLCKEWGFWGTVDTQQQMCRKCGRVSFVCARWFCDSEKGCSVLWSLVIFGLGFLDLSFKCHFEECSRHVSKDQALLWAVRQVTHTQSRCSPVWQHSLISHSCVFRPFEFNQLFDESWICLTCLLFMFLYSCW